MQIKRNIIEVFRQWKEAADRKPILLKGARQIGKTWAIETFGKESYFIVIYPF
jgi:predicted AAA+ superfamily ATPase